MYEWIHEHERYTDPKKCFVPTCSKSDKKNPGLKFFAVRSELKENWCHLTGRNCPKRTLYCCEDHLNLEEDLENYNKWIAGAKPRLKLNATLKNYLKKPVEFVGDIPQAYTASAVFDVETIHTVSQPGSSKVLGPTTSLDSNAFKEEDPLSSRVIDQCRFCGEFSKDCVPVSGNMPYLAHNKTTLVLNDTSVQLDFNDGSLPKTVCRDCDAKLQEIAGFVKVVKAAQDTLINVAEERAEYAETRVEFEVAKAGEIVNTESETLVIKTEYDSHPEESDHDKDDKEGILDSLSVGETVFVKKTVTHKRKSDSETAQLQNFKTKKCDDELVIHIKEEVIEKEGQSEVSDDVNPSELELATSAIVFGMAGEGTKKYKGYRSHR